MQPSAWRSRLDQGGVDAVMADARSFARRRPGAFLLGAVTVGFLTGRLVRNLSGGSQPAPNGCGQRASGDPGVRRHGQRVRRASRQPTADRHDPHRARSDATESSPTSRSATSSATCRKSSPSWYRAQTELAKTEIRTQADKAKRAAGAFGGAAVGRVHGIGLCCRSPRRGA